MPKPHDLRAYIEARIARGPGCWSWTGPVQPSGYGLVNLPSRRTRAHRAVYELLVGPIPDGLQLDHLCHNRDLSCKGGDGCAHRRCVNPAHLEPATPRENVTRGRTTPALNLAKTACPAGHPYDRRDVRGWRKCQRCINARQNELRRAAGGRGGGRVA